MKSLEHQTETTDAIADLAPSALLDAIEESLLEGDVHIALGLLQSIRRRTEAPLLEMVGGCDLTDRERTTLALLPDAALGQKDMARILGISHNTLKTHLRSLYQKLGVHSRAEAIEWCSRRTPGRAGNSHLVAV